MNEITVYIKTLSGEVIPISFEPKDRNVHLIFKVQTFFPEYPVERILLYHNDFIDISNVKDGDILLLFICQPYEESWSSLSIKNPDYNTYIVNWYNSENYFYNKEKKSSIYLYIDVDKNNNFRVYVSNNEYLLLWFPDLKQALFNFQKEYNSRIKHTLFTDDKLIHSYHLWNLNAK